MRRMQPFDRALCVSAGLLGVGVFGMGLVHGGVGILIGIAALLIGLITAGFVTYRGRWP